MWPVFGFLLQESLQERVVRSVRVQKLEGRLVCWIAQDFFEKDRCQPGKQVAVVVIQLGLGRGKDDQTATCGDELMQKSRFCGIESLQIAQQENVDPSQRISVQVIEEARSDVQGGVGQRRGGEGAARKVNIGWLIAQYQQIYCFRYVEGKVAAVVQRQVVVIDFDVAAQVSGAARSSFELDLDLFSRPRIYFLPTYPLIVDI